MKHRTLHSMRIPFVVIFSTFALLAMASVAMAGQGLHVNKNQRVMLRGTYSYSPEGYADCFQAQVLTESNHECVRLQVLQRPDTDLEMVLTCPGGETWRDDDSGGAARPLIKAQTSTKGWCTVQVCHWAGTGPSKADFVMAYGRYDLDHPACANLTPTLEPDPCGGPLPESGKQE